MVLLLKQLMLYMDSLRVSVKNVVYVFTHMFR